MTQPSSVYEWCKDTTDPDGKLLKVEAPLEVIQTGLLRQTPFARVWHNYMFNNISEHLQFVANNVLQVGAVLSYKQGSAPNFGVDFQGTWVSIGTQVIGPTTVEYFERTA